MITGCKHLPFLRVKVVDFIPSYHDWVGLYRPFTRTIYIKRGPRMCMAYTLVHESGHWSIHLFGGTHELQQAYEAAWDIMDRSLNYVFKIVGTLAESCRMRWLRRRGNR